MATGTIQSTAWKFAGATKDLTIPDNCQELLLVVTYTRDGFNWSFNINIPGRELAANRRFFSGYNANSGATYVGFNVNDNATKITLQSFYVDNANVINSGTVNCYYR